MSAPARAIDHAERTRSRPSDPRRRQALRLPRRSRVPVRPKPAGGGFPWVIVLCVVPVLSFALLAWATFRRSDVDGR